MFHNFIFQNIVILLYYNRYLDMCYSYLGKYMQLFNIYIYKLQILNPNIFFFLIIFIVLTFYSVFRCKKLINVDFMFYNFFLNWYLFIRTG